MPGSTPWPSSPAYWRRGERSGLHKTAVYGRRIGARLLDEAAAKDLADYELVLRRHAGEETWSALTQAREQEESGQARPRDR